MLSSFIPISPLLAARSRRIVAGAVLIATGYIAALVAAPSSDVRFDLGIGRAAAAKHAAVDETGAGASSPAAAVAEARRDFDYFPDHYTNRARDVVEQPPTF